MKKLPHFLLVSGNGQNAGKTKLATELILRHSDHTQVMAVKVSPHFHPLPPDTEFLVRNSKFEIIRETKITNKDSSRLLQAGANPGIYIQCKDENLALAIQEILPLAEGKAVVCESGGLASYFIPGISVYMNNSANESMKALNHQPDFIIPSQNAEFSFPHQRLHFSDGKWVKT